MAHPVAASRALDFFLDLGNLTKSVGGNVVTPPNNEEYWKAKGAGTYIGWEWTIYKASQVEVEDGPLASSGDIYWDSVTLGLENGPEPLFGFKVSVRGYQDVITSTPAPVDEDGNSTGDPTWSNTRTYPPQTGVECKFTNSQQRIPPLWPSPTNTTDYSTVVSPRRFEGITLYGSDKTVSDGTSPVIVGIAEGEARCVGFVETKDDLTVNFTAPGSYYVALDTMKGYIRTPDDRIEPLVNNNDDTVDSRTVPIPGGVAGRINFPEELPRSTPANPIAVGTTYIQVEDPNGNFVIPFPGFVGRHLWVYTDVVTGNFDGTPVLDQNEVEITDFRWQRTTRPFLVSGYNYVLVFDEAEFEYIQRQGGPTREEIFLKNPAVDGEWFPTEPYDPDATPALYPYDTIPTFVPDERETVDVFYGVSITGTPAGASSIGISQTCIAPTRNWQRMLKALLARAYYTNGMARSYAAVPGYCDPNSPNFGENQQDPYCVETGQS